MDGVPDAAREQTGRARCFTPPITAADLRHVPDPYFALTADADVAVAGRRLWSVGGTGDLRATALQDLDEAELWLARTLHAGQATSSEDDQTSRGDTEDELSK